MAEQTAEPTTWQRIAKRIRVPLGFVFAAVFLFFAHPTFLSLGLSLIPVAAGVWLRGYSAGYIKKNAELTQTGPYAYTRNPLYLGSMAIAFGFGAASGSWMLVLLLTGLFLAIYVPVIQGEEQFLRNAFPDFDAYATRVPRLLPRLSSGTPGSASASFSRERYLHHREYNALMGVGAIYAALLLKMLLASRHAF